MPIRQILVYVDTSPTCDARLQVAVCIARRLDANLIGVALPSHPELEERFMAWVRNAGVVGEWRLTAGWPGVYLTKRALVSACVVLGRAAPGWVGEAPEDVILGCGRPVIVAPDVQPFASVGDQVLVAWDGGREATRALHDALPLLKTPVALTVFSVNPDAETEQKLRIDLVSHLARHGIEAMAETVASIRTPAEAVLARARDIDADLIVMGAYGHSRLREMILGGTTRDILRDMTVPVLMSH
jgi:nucleotide-binding universal stress UspA family protein